MPDIFLKRSTGVQDSNDTGRHQSTNSGSQNSDQGSMGSEKAGNGPRGHVSEFPRSAQSHTNHTKGPRQGRTAEGTADANTKQKEQKTASGPPTPHPGRKGGVEGGEWWWRRLKNCLSKALHCHSHTNRTPPPRCPLSNTIRHYNRTLHVNAIVCPLSNAHDFGSDGSCRCGHGDG